MSGPSVGRRTLVAVGWPRGGLSVGCRVAVGCGTTRRRLEFPGDFELVTCHPVTPLLVAFERVPSRAASSRFCRILMCRPWTLPHPTIHWTRTPSPCRGLMTFPGPATRAVLSNCCLATPAVCIRNDSTSSSRWRANSRRTFDLADPDMASKSASRITVAIVTADPGLHVIVLDSLPWRSVSGFAPSLLATVSSSLRRTTKMSFEVCR